MCNKILQQQLSLKRKPVWSSCDIGWWWWWWSLLVCWACMVDDSLCNSLSLASLCGGWRWSCRLPCIVIPSVFNSGLSSYSFWTFCRSSTVNFSAKLSCVKYLCCSSWVHDDLSVGSNFKQHYMYIMGDYDHCSTTDWGVLPWWSPLLVDHCEGIASLLDLVLLLQVTSCQQINHFFWIFLDALKLSYLDIKILESMSTSSLRVCHAS